MKENEKITVEAQVNRKCSRVWEFWTVPEHIIKWNYATDKWHSPHAENDLKVGGKFSFRMEAKDGSMGFDFTGTYDEIRLNERIAFTLEDGRKVEIVFSDEGPKTRVTEVFEADSSTSFEMQKNGWQAILGNFKKYAEKQA